MSQIRQNYSEESEAAINKQINMEFYASYVYEAMASYFGQDTVALPGYQKYFQSSSNEEREHAQKFIKYQNDRGGRLVLKDIKAPSTTSWKNGVNALEDALELEKKVNESLLLLHKTASNTIDPHLADFLETEFLDEQVKSIKLYGDLITKAKRCGDGLGEFTFDHEVMSELSS